MIWVGIKAVLSQKQFIHVLYFSEVNITTFDLVTRTMNSQVELQEITTLEVALALQTHLKNWKRASDFSQSLGKTVNISIKALLYDIQRLLFMSNASVLSKSANFVYRSQVLRSPELSVVWWLHETVGTRL